MITWITISTLVLLGLTFAAMLPGEIAQSRVDRRLKDLDKKRAGIKLTSRREDLSILCDQHFGRYKFYQSEKKRMQRAGMLESWQTVAFLIAQVLFVALGIVAASNTIESNFHTISNSISTVGKSILVVVVCGCIPRVWLLIKISENQKRLRKTMPIAVELMTICMESGNGLEQTFQKVGTELMGTNRQIATAILETRSEMVVYDRKWALEKLQREGELEEQKELARSLLESLQYGTPLVLALRNLAQRMREENMNRLEEVAGKASTKMTVPMIIFLLFPVIVIAMAEPVVMFLRGSFL